MDTQRTAIGVVPDRTEPEPCQRAAVHAERLCSPMLNQIIQLVMQAASRIPTKAITASAQSIVCLRSVSGLRQLGGRPAGQADPASRAAQRAVSTPRSIQICTQQSVRAAASAGGTGSMPSQAPVGQWQSPITSEMITSKSIGLGAAKAGPDGLIYWLEARPTEGGRSVLVRRNRAGSIEDVTPAQSSGFNIRTTVHEYGGGAFTLSKDHVYFSNFKDQVVYAQSLGDKPGDPKGLTSSEAKHRFADAVVDEPRQRLLAVREDHSGSGEPANTIAAISLKDGSETVLTEGYDFYASPRLSPDGTQLAWVAWRHPNMPWDDTELFVAAVKSDGSLEQPVKIAGGRDESVMQPCWLQSGDLVFISDQGNGWWNLYLHQAGKDPRAIAPMEAEFGSPGWVFGIQNYTALPQGKLLASYSDPKEAGGKLAIIDVASGELQHLQTPYSSHGGMSVQNGRLATTGGGPKQPSEIAVLDIGSGKWESLRKSLNLELDTGFLSAPEVVEYPTEGGKTAFMNYYPPRNKDWGLPQGHLPPLLVMIHGGPTSQCSANLSLKYQFWTSRGYALADINYGGSTGFGREYRNRLRGNWGVVDVDDCCNAAKHLAKEGKVDPKRLCITGGSAGGYTTLACLAYRDVFSAGTSHYGVADCELLAQETHKFESRYLDLLIGPYPQDKKTYEERSAINALDGFSAPVMFFQGKEDKVVPPNQAEDMYKGLKERGVTTGLVLFDGEQHGFRGSNAIRRAMEGEFYFYGKVLGFDAAMSPDLETFEIAHLKTA